MTPPYGDHSCSRKENYHDDRTSSTDEWRAVHLGSWIPWILGPGLVPIRERERELTQGLTVRMDRALAEMEVGKEKQP